MSNLIGLTGHAGSGKDLVSSMLRMKGYERFGFADELKIELYDEIAGASQEIKEFLAEFGICLVEK